MKHIVFAISLSTRVCLSLRRRGACTSNYSAAFTGRALLETWLEVFALLSVANPFSQAQQKTAGQLSDGPSM